MTAVTAYLTHALGAYRSPHDEGVLFMVLTAVRWATPADTLIHGQEDSPPSTP